MTRPEPKPQDEKWLRRVIREEMAEALRSFDPQTGPETYVPRPFSARQLADHIQRLVEQQDG